MEQLSDLVLESDIVLKLGCFVWFRYNQQKCSEVSGKSWQECENKLPISYLRGSSGAPDNKNVYEKFGTSLGDRNFIDSKIEETSQDDGDLFETQIDLESSSTAAVASTQNKAAKIYDGGIYLAFTDHGSCTVIHSIKVFYYFCPRTVSNFAIYPKTTSTGLSRKVSGQCTSGTSKLAFHSKKKYTHLEYNTHYVPITFWTFWDLNLKNYMYELS